MLHRLSNICQHARSIAKRRMAAVQAGRAVALALTPGVPAIRQVTILPRGGIACRIDYEPLVQHPRRLKQ